MARIRNPRKPSCLTEREAAAIPALLSPASQKELQFAGLPRGCANRVFQKLGVSGRIELMGAEIIRLRLLLKQQQVIPG